jgi:hypothetical protein
VQLVDTFQHIKSGTITSSTTLLMLKTLFLILILVTEIFIIVKVLDDLTKAAKECGKRLHNIEIDRTDPRLRTSVSKNCRNMSFNQTLLSFLLHRLNYFRCKHCKTTPNIPYFQCIALTGEYFIRLVIVLRSEIMFYQIYFFHNFR